MQENIILIGFMGAGKSTLGRKLALALDIPFIDSDIEIEKKYNRSIVDLFEERGEAGFRQLEVEFLNDLATHDPFILATGGGMPCTDENIQRINQIGHSIYIKLSVNDLVLRLKSNQETRPLVKSKNELEMQTFVAERLVARERFYLQARTILNAPEQDFDFLLNLIVKKRHND